MKRSRVSKARREFERTTLLRLKAAGAGPRQLRRCQWLLTKRRKSPGDDYCGVLNAHSAEKAGIEIYLQALQGAPPIEQIIFRIRPEPAHTFNG